MASRYRGRDGRPIQSRADRGQFSSGNSVAVPTQTGWAAMFGGGGGRNANDDDDNFNATGAEGVMMGHQDVEEDRTDLLRIILYELNTAIAPRKARLEAIRSALLEFDHNETALHDEELDVQADRILYQKLALAYAVSRSSDGVVAGYSSGGPNNANQGGPRMHHGDADEELELIATALEMVYRASRSMVALSFTEVGRAMLPLCIDMIGNPRPPPPPPPPSKPKRLQLKVGSSATETEELGSAGSNTSSESDPKVISKDGGKKRVSSADITLHTVSDTLTTMDSTLEAEDNNNMDGSRKAKNDKEGGKVNVGPPANSTDFPAKATMGPEGDDKDDYPNPNEIFTTRVQHGDDEEEEEKKSGDDQQEEEAADGDDSVDSAAAHAHAHHSIADVSHEAAEQDSDVSEISDTGLGVPHTGSASMSQQIAGGNVLAPAGAPQDATFAGAGASGDGSSKQGSGEGGPKSASHASAYGTIASKRNLTSTYADDVAGDDEDLYVAWARRPDSDDEKEDEQATAKAKDDEDDEDTQEDSLTKQRKIRFWDERSSSGRLDAEEEPPSGLAKDYADDEGKINAVAAGKIVKILRYYSRVLSAMSPMARQAGLLDALIYQMGRRMGTFQRRTDVDLEGNIEMDDDDSDPLAVAPDGNAEDFGWIERQKKMLDAEVAPIRVDAVATLVNLACAEENKTLMLNHPGLLEAVVDVTNADPSEEAREHGAIVLMNLAYADDNKIAIGHNNAVLSTLANLAGDKSPFTRKYSTAALFTLACIPQNAKSLACHRGGFILSALARLLLEDPIEEARINAAEAAFNLAKNAANVAQDESVVLALGSHVGLLPSLAHAVMADNNADVRTYAARTLEWMASDIHNGMPCHDNLLRALTKATLWTKTCCIVEALAAQAMVTENRPAMILHDGLLDALASLALLEDIGDEEVRECAISTLVELTKEESLRKVMGRSEGVLTALTHATFTKQLRSNNSYKGKQSQIVTKTKIALKNLAGSLEED